MFLNYKIEDFLHMYTDRPGKRIMFEKLVAGDFLFIYFTISIKSSIFQGSFCNYYIAYYIGNIISIKM